MEQNLSATERNFSTLARREDLAGTGIDGHTEVLRRLRGHEIRLLLVYHNPEGATKREELPDRFLGLLLRGGENQPIVQVTEQSDPTRVCPSRHRREDPGKDLGSSRQTEAQGSKLVNCPLRHEPQQLPR